MIHPFSLMKSMKQSSKTTMAHQVQSSPRIEIPGRAQPVPTQNIHYLEDSVQEDAKYQVQWSNWMEQKTFYRHVFVLLLSWHPACDDMAVQEEVKRLKDVFETKYKYEVENFQIDSRLSSLPQAQVNLAVAQFVHRNDQDNALFIIYYAGHGSSGKDPGDLKMSGRRRNKDKSHQFTHITWNLVESNLRTTRADVFLIFDCCHAGDLGREAAFSSRSFEYLAATQSDYTRSPGPHSFTSALIWALLKLAKPSTQLSSSTPPMFTSSKLAKTIFDCPDFPKEQKPSLTTRDHDAWRHIILAPLTHEGVAETRPQPDSDDENDEEEEVDKSTPQYLSLTFHFKERQDETELRRLAEHLKTFMKAESTTLQKVQWGGIWTGASIPPRNRLRQAVLKIMSQSPTSASRNPLSQPRRFEGDRLAPWTDPGPNTDDQASLVSGASSAIFEQTPLLSSATSIVAEQTFHRPSFWSRILSVFRGAREPVIVEPPSRPITTQSSWKGAIKSMLSRIFKLRSSRVRIIS